MYDRLENEFRDRVLWDVEDGAQHEFLSKESALGSFMVEWVLNASWPIFLDHLRCPNATK